MNEVDEFLGGLKGEQDNDPFKSEAKDPFENLGSKEEVKGSEEEVDEKPLPFHKDPKITKFIEKEISKRMEEYKPSAEKEFKEENKDLIY